MDKVKLTIGDWLNDGRCYICVERGTFLYPIEALKPHKEIEELIGKPFNYVEE